MARKFIGTSFDLRSRSWRADIFAIRQGFTIVELLIAIVVIAILAAITIVAYNGITNRAIETTMQSDLRTAATSLEIDHENESGYPADASGANGGAGLKSSGNNALSYTRLSDGYCIEVTNPRSTKTFRLKSDGGQIEEGTCAPSVPTGEQVAKLVASDGAANDYFGRSVSVACDTALIGAYYDLTRAVLVPRFEGVDDGLGVAFGWGGCGDGVALDDDGHVS